MSFKLATSASVRRALRPLQRWFDATDRPDRSRTGRTVGTRRFEYDPRDDDRADPGEIVWAWVSYEDDPSRGKDRPVLITARDGADLLGLYLSSKDHERDAADEASHGRYWLELGSGPWDQRGRPSQVRLDRVVHLNPDRVRRIGARLDRQRFDQVVAAAGRH